MKFINKHIFGLLGLLALLSTCSIREGGTDEPAGTGTKVRFELFTKAGTYGLPVARAGAEESVVDKQPWVLVFRGTGGTASFVEAVHSELYNNKTYVYLEEQTSACQLLILANPPNQFYVGGTGYTYTAENFANTLDGHDLNYACLNLLTEALPDPQYTVPYVGQKLPMSDLVDVSKIDAGVTIPDIKLERVVGKVIVRNTAPDFVLEGITTVTNTPKRGQFYRNGTLQESIGAGNLVEYRGDISYNSDVVEADVVTVGQQSTKLSPLYLYESHSKTNGTYLIVRGTYKGVSYFYKMAFVDNNQNVLSILRNTEYVFTITSIRGPGFVTMRDAKMSLASNTNLNYTILVRDDSSYETMSNNDYYLGVTNSHFEVYGVAGETYTAFALVTDCKIEFPDKRTITSLTTGLTIESPSDGKLPVSTSNPCEVKIKMSTGFTTGEIELYLGNLKKIITVRLHPRLDYRQKTITGFMEGGYYISAHVENYTTHKWLELASVNDDDEVVVRNDPDFIYVDNGKIALQVKAGSNSTVPRSGNVYISARGEQAKRIKVHVTQNAR